MKRFFLKGLFAILPIVLTAAVVYLVIGFLYNNVGVPIRGTRFRIDSYQR
jgi:uncharacterized membrane protein